MLRMLKVKTLNVWIESLFGLNSTFIYETFLEFVQLLSHDPKSIAGGEHALKGKLVSETWVEIILSKGYKSSFTLKCRLF